EQRRPHLGMARSFQSNQLFAEQTVLENVRLVVQTTQRGSFSMDLFRAHHWPPAWRFGVFDFHHYHSTAHEVLGVFAGSARLLFGGPDGVTVEAQAGDAIVIPAGVAHKCLVPKCFRVVGAYPRGQDFDMNRGEPGERPAADHHIAEVPLPAADPVLGPSGPLSREWDGKARPQP
ncbi:MAG: cupin domain-containing protein, partial [Thiohalorhabdaceae bacterium]